MGLLADLRRIADATGSLMAGPSVTVASPMHPRPNHLESVVWHDLVGREYAPVTRADAMRVPALARSRQLIVTTIARLPLRAVRDGEPLERQPLWIDRTSGPVAPFHRMLWTADDLLFYGWSLWAVRRNSEGEVIEADRVPYGSWEINDDHGITVNGRRAAADDVVLIPGIHDGILTHGDEVIRQARALNAAAGKAADMPMALVNLQQTNDAPMTESDIDAVVKRWAAARRGENAGVSFTSSGLKVEEMGSAQEHLLIQGRNAIAVDIARVCGIPAPMIDAAIAGSSLTYTNTQARLSELIAFGVAPLLYAIAARLGLDDVVPRGTALEFDTTEAVTLVDAAAPQDDGNAPRAVPFPTPQKDSDA